MALAAKVFEFGVGVLTIIVIVGFTGIASLAALGLFVGERDKGGEG